MPSKLLKICVPSKARAEIFKKRTLSILQHTSLPWAVFVEPQDYRDYVKTIPPEFQDNIICLPRNNQGLGYVLNAIRDHGSCKGYRFIWKMDDDVSHWYQSSRVVEKSVQGGILNNISQLLEEAESVLRDKLGGFSFPPKFFHSNWRSFTHVNKMFETTYIVKTSDWFVPTCLKGYHEEFVASAHLLTLGKVVLRIGAYCWDADLSSFPGGLQSFDRTVEQSVYFDKLESEFPELMRYTQRKEYVQKTGKTFTVTDKKQFNKLNSVRLYPFSAILKSSLHPEVIECLSKLV